MVDIANLEWGIPGWVKGDRDGFTWGDIYLKEGQNLWDPETVALLGHELLHLSDQTHEFGGMTLVWGLDYLLQYGLNRLVGMDDNAAYNAIRTEVRAWELQQAIQEWLRVLDYKPNACCP
jgi:hypothetical protein